MPAHRIILAALIAAACASGCHVVESKAYNLEQLHDGESHHRYHAALEGDFEYVIRHHAAGAFEQGSALASTKDESKVDDPATKCLGYLVELESFSPADPRAAALQIEWFARLAVEDPWSLCRERSVSALARAGERLNVGLPRKLGADEKAATPEEIGAALESLVHAVRRIVRKEKDAAVGLTLACDELRTLQFDLAGGRRALHAVDQLADTLGLRDERVSLVRDLVTELQSVCVRRALATAIEDADPIVRAAALRSVARCGGVQAVDVVLFDRLRKEIEIEPLVAGLDVLAQNGLPEAQPNGKPNVHGREDWLKLVYDFVSSGADGEVRVHAMMALSRIADAKLHSLHEEDWQRWWLARTPAPAASPGTGP